MRKDLANRVSMASSLATIAGTGWRAATVIDVGVGLGTDGLYDAFPEARLVLVEPVAEAAPFMDDIASRRPGTIVVPAAAGAVEGSASLAVVPGITGSTMYRSGGDGVEMRTVATVTLDGLVARHALEPPFLIKLDVEGHELEVLRGADRALDLTDVVVSEVSVWGGGVRPTVADLVNLLAARGLVLHDVANLGYRGVDDALLLLDLVFVRHDSLIRRNKSAKTPEQAAAARLHKQEKMKRALERLAAREGAGP